MRTQEYTAVICMAERSVTAGERKCHRRGKLGLAFLFRNFNVCCIELSIAVGLEDTENVPDNLLLPVDEL